MQRLREIAYKYVGAAFMEDKGGTRGAVASLGRYFAVPAMGVILHKMATGGTENPVTMMDTAVLGLLLGYNGFTKMQQARKS